jgi:interferon gamma-inducible protein 30
MLSYRVPSSIKRLIVVIAAHIALAGFLWSPADGASSFEDRATTDEKVGIALYYESQCPGCRDMITNSFSEAFQTEGFLDMAEVEFVPYGNAKETKTESGTYEFECQHGPSECVYNTIEACALAKIEDPLVAFQYIDCIECSDESRDPQQDYYQVAITCCKLAKLSDDTIRAMEGCATGTEGIQLEHEAAEKTDGLDPPHEFGPYVVVNGVHKDETQNAISDSLFDYVCGAYLGPNKSPACPGAEKAAAPSLRAGTVGREQLSPDNKKMCYRKDGPANFASGLDAGILDKE